MAAPRCGGGCDGREDGAVEALLQWQKVSDFLIGASYLSIPLELLHFATCADLAPLRWVLLQFGAFTVLCGIVHFAAVLTYARPDSRRLLLAFTAAKALAALAASVAAVSLPAFIPQLRPAPLCLVFAEEEVRVEESLHRRFAPGGGGRGARPREMSAGRE